MWVCAGLFAVPCWCLAYRPIDLRHLLLLPLLLPSAPPGRPASLPGTHHRRGRGFLRGVAGGVAA